VRIMQTDTNTIPLTLQPSRMRHAAIIGQAGSGKANLLSQLIQFDIGADHGLILFDLDGDATDTALRLVPERRIKDVVVIDLSDTEFPSAINPLAGTGTDYDTVIADHLVDAFKSIAGYDQMATPDMDRTIYNAARAIIDLPNGTILDMYRMLISEEARARIVKSVRDPIVKAYWNEQFARLDPREQAFMT
jgi:DNA helicase HerA-like ATPase